MENEKKRGSSSSPLLPTKTPTTGSSKFRNKLTTGNTVHPTIARLERTTPEINMEDTIGQQHIPIVTSNLYRLPLPSTGRNPPSFKTISPSDASSPFHYPSIRNRKKRLYEHPLSGRATFPTTRRLPTHPFPPPQRGKGITA